MPLVHHHFRLQQHSVASHFPCRCSNICCIHVLLILCMNGKSIIRASTMAYPYVGPVSIHATIPNTESDRLPENLNACMHILDARLSSLSYNTAHILYRIYWRENNNKIKREHFGQHFGDALIRLCLNGWHDADRMPTKHEAFWSMCPCCEIGRNCSMCQIFDA